MFKFTEYDWDLLRFYFVGSIIATVIFVMAIFAMAEEIRPPVNLWKGLIAEAVGEGSQGMTAVCLVYRNRLQKGLKLGCTGLFRQDLDEFVYRQGIKYERLAKGIVARIFAGKEPDITGGATHYENIETFGMPRWAKRMKRTVKIGAHTFFKESK